MKLLKNMKPSYDRGAKKKIQKNRKRNKIARKSRVINRRVSKKSRKTKYM